MADPNNVPTAIMASMLGVMQARDIHTRDHRGSYGPPSKRRRTEFVATETVPRASEIRDQRVTAEQALR
jgi:hypothetical protein